MREGGKSVALMGEIRDTRRNGCMRWAGEGEC